MAKKSKFYVVWQGVTPGIYDSWAKCQEQIKGYPGAKYKSFTSLQEAEAAFVGQDFSTKTYSNKAPKNPNHSSIIQQSISVDAACSGNPGVMEYQGVWTYNGARIFHQKFDIGTNNIGEFLALVHCLAMLDKKGDAKTPIYSDSKIAMGWVQKGTCKTNLNKSPKTAGLYQLIERAEKWLATHTIKNPILKWETKVWGEIPADFGRK